MGAIPSFTTVQERLMLERSGDYLTMREALSTFVTRPEFANLQARTDEHRQDDVSQFSRIDVKLDVINDKIEKKTEQINDQIEEKLNDANKKTAAIRDEIMATRLPKWAYWLMGFLATVAVPFLVVVLEKALK